MKKFEEFNRVNQFELPLVVDPDRICVCFEIPNERFHIRAFWTALYKLTLWNTWKTDDAHTGRLAAAVWRDVWNKALGDNDTMGCGCSNRPALRRISPQGIMQVSYDDGETWQDDKANDGRFSNPTLPPLTSGTAHERRCTMANSVVTALNEEQLKQLDILQDQANLATSIFDSIAAFLAIVGATGVGALFALISLLIGLLVRTIISMLPEDFESQFTLTTWQALLCIVYCEIDDDGRITEAAWQTIKQRVLAEVTTEYAAHWCADMINAMGVVGITNAALAGYGGARDCTGCDCDEEWCYEFDFLASSGGFAGSGSWSAGNGWEATTGGTGVRVDVTKTVTPSPVITHAEMDVTFINRGNVACTLGGVAMLNFENVQSGTYEWDGSISGSTQLRLFPTSGASQGNQCTMTRLLLRGTGVNPFGTDNCT